MKKLYEFVSLKTQETEEKVPSKNVAGENIIEVKKITKKTPARFYLRKPNRALGDDAALFESVQFSEAIKAGMLTYAQLASKFADEAKAYSEEETKNYQKNLNEITNKQTLFQKLSLKKEEDMTEDEKKEVKTLFDEIIILQDSIQSYRAKESYLYSRTAEAWARNRLLLWWVFQLAHNENGTPVYGNGTFKDKLAAYDKFEEDEDVFMLKLSNKLLFLISFWLAGKTEKPQDFDDLSKVAGIYEEIETPKAVETAEIK